MYKDNRDPQKVGEALLAMKKQLPNMKLSEIADLHETVRESHKEIHDAQSNNNSSH